MKAYAVKVGALVDRAPAWLTPGERILTRLEAAGIDAARLTLADDGKGPYGKTPGPRAARTPPPPPPADVGHFPSAGANEPTAMQPLTGMSKKEVAAFLQANPWGAKWFDFWKTGGGTFFHGTASEALASIKAHGLVPRGGAGADTAVPGIGQHTIGDRAASVYMAEQDDRNETVATAVQYGRMVAGLHPGSQPVVLAIRIPAKQRDKVVVDERSVGEGAVRLKIDRIPPEWIKVYVNPQDAKKHGTKPIYRDLRADDGDVTVVAVLVAHPEAPATARSSIDLADGLEGKGPYGKTPGSPSVHASIVRLARTYPGVRDRYRLHSGTSRGSVGAHTLEVGTQWPKQIAPADLQGISRRWGHDVGGLLHDAIALHDIGKGHAVAVGEKHAQHAFTTPILQAVLRREGHPPADVRLATELFNHDLIGELLQARPRPGDGAHVARAIAQKAQAVGMSVPDFATLQLAVYHADAGAYPRVRQKAMVEDARGKLSMRAADRMAPITALTRPSAVQLAADAEKGPYGKPPRGATDAGVAGASEHEAQQADDRLTAWLATAVPAVEAADPARRAIAVKAHLTRQVAADLTRVHDDATLRHVRDQIREGAPLPPDGDPGADVAHLLLKAWAQTSSDSDPVSRAVQQAAAQQFDLRNADPLDPTGTAPVDAQTRAVIDTFVQTTYERTQRALQDAGITHLTLYRGLAVPGTERVEGRQRLTKVPTGVTTLGLRPLSSFTTDFETAHDFAQMGFDEDDLEDPLAVTAMVRVPASRVFSTFATGAGCLAEHEVILRGGPVQAFVTARGQYVGLGTAQAAFHDKAQAVLHPTSLRADDADVLHVDADLANADWPKRTVDVGVDVTQVDPDLPVARWARGDGTPRAVHAHAYRLGWCLTCHTPAFDCRDVGPDGKGPYGKEPQADTFRDKLAAQREAGAAAMAATRERQQAEAAETAQAAASGWKEVGRHQLTPDEQTRLRALKLPPAWTQVRLSADPAADLQATGVDGKGRTQYRYSVAHTERAANEKFARGKEFAAVVPTLRTQFTRDLADTRLSETERDAATVLYLIDKTGFRIGSDADTGADVKAHGASTLTADHVTIDGPSVAFDFIGKKGVRIQKTVEDATLAKALRPRVARGGPLFAASDADVRDYLHARAPGFKVKDFRTHVAVKTALHAMQDMPVPTSKTAFTKARKAVGSIVAEALGNTPTVALASYIDPQVFAKWKAASGG